MRHKTAVAALLATFGTAACIQEPMMHADRPHALTSRESHKYDVVLDGVGANPGLKHVRAARLSPDGRGIVILGSEPPFIHVFDVAGGASRSFGTAGEGADALRHPVAIALSKANELLVADASGSAMVFALDGSVRAYVADTGVLPMAAAAACDAEWLIYGPRKDAQGGVYTEWLHGLTTEGVQRGLSAHGLVGRAPAGTVGLGRPFGLVTRNGGAVLRHDDGDAPGVVGWECGNTITSSIMRPGEAHPTFDAPAHSTGGVAVRAPHGRAAPSGLAAVGDAVAIADVTFGDEMETEFTLLRDGREERIRVKGGYVLRDSRPGVGVLVEEVGPAPHLFILGEQEFLGLFG